MSLLDALLLDPQKVDVWIALRTDGVKGSGTDSDPYDGSPRNEGSLTVSTLTRSDRTATATTASNHGYLSGDVVTIAGVTGAGAQFYNGTFVISTVPTANSFTYWMKADAGADGSGPMTCARTFYQLDEVMATLGANTAVHLGPGLFLTRGYREGEPNPRIHSGQTIRGAGMYLTTVKLVNASVANAKYAVLGALPTGAELESLEVSDLTLDCNFDGQLIAGQEFPLIACMGIMASGAHLLYRRLRAINFGTLQFPYECFVLWSAGANPGAAVESVDCVVEDCVVEQPAINQSWITTCINMGAGEDGAGIMGYHRACVVRNCLIDCEFKFNPVAILQITFTVINPGPSQIVEATVTTRGSHGRQVNDWVRIAGAMVNGSLANAFNGSFKITAQPQPDQFKYQNQTTDTPAAAPTGDMWVDRFSSHFVPHANISAAPGPGSKFTVTVTTEMPHFRVPGNNVSVSDVWIWDGTQPVLSPIYNGSFKVEDNSPWDPKKLKYLVNSDPGPGLYPGFNGPFLQGIGNDGGTAAVVEGNRVLNTRIGGPYHDTYSTKSLIVRNNYYRSVVTGPYHLMSGESSHPTPAAPLAPIAHDGLIATFTINSTKPHGFTVGQGVRIQGATINGDPSNPFNGLFAIQSIPTPTSFTYKMASVPSADHADQFSGTVSALWQVQQCVIENNVIELIPSFMAFGAPFGILLAASPPAAFVAIGARVFRRVVIRNNVIRYVDNLTEQTVRNVAIDLSYCEDALVENNVVDLAIADPIRHSNSNSVKYFQNTNPAGQLIQGLLVPATGPSVKQDELTTFIEDAATLCIL